jgi:hypothetical protein
MSLCFVEKPLPYGRGSDQRRINSEQSRDRKGAVSQYVGETLNGIPSRNLTSPGHCGHRGEFGAPSPKIGITLEPKVETEKDKGICNSSNEPSGPAGQFS